jgi:excisionase family DNA binding protein
MLAHADRHELLTVKETASLLRLHPMTVRRMIEQGAIPAAQLAGKGTSIRIPAEGLARFCVTDDEPRSAA